MLEKELLEKNDKLLNCLDVLYEVIIMEKLPDDLIISKTENQEKSGKRYFDEGIGVVIIVVYKNINIHIILKGYKSRHEKQYIFFKKTSKSIYFKEYKYKYKNYD